MRASNALREELANRYMTQMDWRQAATIAGLQPSHIAMQGSSFAVWTNILEIVRTQNRLDGLRELVDLQHPELNPLVERYIADVAHGGGELTNLPQLADFALSAADLDVDTLVQTMASLPRAPGWHAGRWTNAANANLDQYRCQQKLRLEPVLQRRRLVESRVGELNREIAALAKLEAPKQPVLDSRAFSDTSQAVRDFYQYKYDQELQAYHAAGERYKAEQARCSGLRSNADEAARELAQLDASISNITAQSAAGERPFYQAIKEAKDQDLVLELSSMLEKAGAAFRNSAEPFKGFYLLLGAGSMLNFIEKEVTSPGFAMDARQRCMTAARALMPFVESEVAAITRGCLAGPTVVARALAANRTTLMVLAARLDQLPAVQLVEGAGRAHAAAMVPPEVPAFDHLELRADIDAMKQRLEALRTSALSQTKRLQAELVTDLRAEVGWVLDDAARTMEQMRNDRQGPATLLEPSQILWTYISCGAESGALPSFTRTLCAALSLEFVSREGARPSAVVETASSTDFAIKDAQALLEEPFLINFQESATLVRDNLAAFESRINDIDTAIVHLKFQIGLVAERYRTKFWWIARLAVLPVVNLILAIWALNVLARLRPLVASGELSYVGLCCYVRRSMFISALLSAVAGVSMVIAPSFSVPLHSVNERWLITMGVCCVVASILFLCSLVAALLLKPASCS